jgi:hypothetical protein
MRMWISTRLSWIRASSLVLDCCEETNGEPCSATKLLRLELPLCYYPS